MNIFKYKKIFLPKSYQTDSRSARTHMDLKKAEFTLIQYILAYSNVRGGCLPRYADTLHPSPSLEGTQNDQTENRD
jgi:hypothetical protein